jgi:hypothetical protein
MACGKVWKFLEGILRFAPGRKGPADSVREMGVGGAAEVRACSACAGDYENPDRTAWTPDNTDEGERSRATDAAEAEEIPGDQQ